MPNYDYFASNCLSVSM